MFSGYYLQITGCKVVRASYLVPKSTSHNHCPCLQPWRPPLTLCNHGNDFNIANCDTCIKPITRCLDAMVTITTSYYLLSEFEVARSDPSFPPLSCPAHRGRVWEPNQYCIPTRSTRVHDASCRTMPMRMCALRMRMGQVELVSQIS